jgi:hypothetical protein
MSKKIKSIPNTDFPSLKDRYELLIKARNFHYENYNKWMTYFYVMISALVIGLCNILSKEDVNIYGKQKNIVLIVAFLGFIISLAWHWANKGYYYWNINFITLVNHYEKNLFNFKENQNNYTNPLKGANISTSKISILLSYVVTVFWGFLISLIILKDGFIYEWLYFLCNILFPMILIFLLNIVIAKKHLNSFHEHFPDLKLEFPTWVNNIG